jgi:uncharacterized membrane protein
MVDAFALLLCLGAGIVGGVFFAFSSFVMKALAELPAANGAHAMQRINVVVLNPVFLGAFSGSALVSAFAASIALAYWDGTRTPWLLAAAILYVGGTFMVTIRGNVPLNNRLAKLDPASAEALDFWPVYVRDWTRLNHLRTVSSIAASACAACALAS